MAKLSLQKEPKVKVSKAGGRNTPPREMLNFSKRNRELTVTSPLK
jgi:hypothetical protein